MVRTYHWHNFQQSHTMLWHVVDLWKIVAMRCIVVRMRVRDVSTTCAGMVGVDMLRVAPHAAACLTLGRMRHAASLKLRNESYATA